MGAQQSSEQSDAPGTSNATVAKTCYYDLLDIDRQATDDEYASRLPKSHASGY